MRARFIGCNKMFHSCKNKFKILQFFNFISHFFSFMLFENNKIPEMA